MHEIIKEGATFNVEALSSKDGCYRYALTRTWDSSLLKAVVIGINPSKATHLKGDNTATNAMNFLIDSGYGEMTMINLFPYRCTNSDELNKRNQRYDLDNLQYVKTFCGQADMILVIWGYDKAKYLEQKKKVEQLLLPYREKVMCFCDSEGKKPQHLRIISDNWNFVSYF